MFRAVSRHAPAGGISQTPSGAGEFERALKRNPSRFLGLCGAAPAAHDTEFLELARVQAFLSHG